MFRSPSTRTPMTRSLDITALESRLLFSTTVVADLVVASGASNGEVDIPVHHAPAEKPPVEFAVRDKAAQSTHAEQQAAEQVQPNLSTDTAESHRLRGDFNHDGQVDATDINLLGKMMQGSEDNSQYDLNRDGGINQLDLDVLIHSILKTEYGDANLDGKVDASDARVIFSNMFQRVAGWQNGDMNFDGVVDGGDYMIWNAHKLFDAHPSVGPTLSANPRQLAELEAAGSNPVQLDATVTPVPMQTTSVTEAKSRELLATKRTSERVGQVNVEDQNPSIQPVEDSGLPMPVIGPITVVPIHESPKSGLDQLEKQKEIADHRLDRRVDAPAPQSPYARQWWLASREYYGSRLPSSAWTTSTFGKLRSPKDTDLADEE